MEATYPWEPIKDQIYQALVLLHVHNLKIVKITHLVFLETMVMYGTTEFDIEERKQMLVDLLNGKKSIKQHKISLHLIGGEIIFKRET